MLSGLEEERSSPASMRKCLEDFSIEVIAGHKTPPLVYGSKSPIPGMVDGIRRYYECEAFLQRRPDICDALARYQNWEVYGETIKTVNKPDDLAYMCRTSYIRLSLIKLNAAGRPDAARVCETLPFHASSEHLFFPTLREECAWMTMRQPIAECANPVDPALGEDAMDCIQHRIVHSDASACPLIEKAPLTPGARAIYQAWCLEAAAYSKAFRAKDAGLCGEILTCRMLMGEKVCDRHLNKLKEDYCRSGAQKKRARSSETDEPIKRRQAQIDALLLRLGDELANFERKSDPAFVSRAEAYGVLRKKAEQAARRPSLP